MSDLTVTKPLRKKKSQHHYKKTEKIVATVLTLIASISILTTVGIVITLVVDASHFFREITIKEMFSTQLAPL